MTFLVLTFGKFCQLLLSRHLKFVRILKPTKYQENFNWKTKNQVGFGFLSDNQNFGFRLTSLHHSQFLFQCTERSRTSPNAHDSTERSRTPPNVHALHRTLTHFPERLRLHRTLISFTESLRYFLARGNSSLIRSQTPSIVSQSVMVTLTVTLLVYPVVPDPSLSANPLVSCRWRVDHKRI